MDIKPLISDKGFIDAFWARLAMYRFDGKQVSQREVFEELNDLYEAETGVERFPSFDAFRMCRDRRTKNSQK